MAKPPKGNGSQPGIPGLNDLFAGEPDPVEREKALESYAFFTQGQPSGFPAHLATLFKAFARTLMAAVGRIEKAAETSAQSASLQVKLTDAQAKAINQALGEHARQAFLTIQQDALEQGNQRLQGLDKRLEQLIATSREAAQARREQHEALRQDEQKARDKHLQATQDGFAALRDELARGRRAHLATVGIAVGLTAALCLGGMAWRHDQAEKAEQAQRDAAAQAFEDSNEGMWWHNLRATRAGLHFMLGDEDASGVSRRLVLTVSPGKEPGSWKLQAANLDAGGNAVLTFRKPEPGAAEATAAAARHR